jgi:hypothetical protein
MYKVECPHCFADNDANDAWFEASEGESQYQRCGNCQKVFMFYWQNDITLSAYELDEADKPEDYEGV